MISAVKPQNEAARLNVLQSYNILDSLPEKEYDDIVKLAAEICQVPISLISLVDENRCWFKAKMGLEQSEAPREIAYAAHAINQPNEPMIIEDALADERFFDCPLVLNDPPMRFYVGTPLVTADNHALGTLCVIDTYPRKLSQTQISTLRILANHVVTCFERKKQLAEIAHLNERLNESYRELEAFSYTVSHDLRAPLRSITGFTQIISEDYAELLPADGKGYLERIYQATTKMDELISDMLRLSKVSRTKLNKQKINFSHLCRNVIDTLAPDSKYDIQLEDNILLNADSGLLRIVAQNIIENALKYSSKEEEPQLKIKRVRYQDQDCIAFEDNGAGFDEKYAKNEIFRPFSRLHSENEFSGTGIGLAIVKKIVDRHKGNLKYKSTIGEGTTFYLNIKK